MNVAVGFEPATDAELSGFIRLLNQTDIHADHRVSLLESEYPGGYVILTDVVSGNIRKVYCDCTSFAQWGDIYATASELTAYRRQHPEMS